MMPSGTDSDHFDAARGQFFNPWADTDRSLRDLFRWVDVRHSGRLAGEHRQPAFVRHARSRDADAGWPSASITDPVQRLSWRSHPP
jgi:hypothetical protein